MKDEELGLSMGFKVSFLYYSIQNSIIGIIIFLLIAYKSSAKFDCEATVAQESQILQETRLH
jgi:hypothetical protein